MILLYPEPSKTKLVKTKQTGKEAQIQWQREHSAGQASWKKNCGGFCPHHHSMTLHVTVTLTIRGICSFN